MENNTDSAEYDRLESIAEARGISIEEVIEEIEIKSIGQEW